MAGRQTFGCNLVGKTKLQFVAWTIFCATHAIDNYQMQKT
jgi:hypothetical protein